MPHPNQCPVSNQTPAEELLNVATHGLGALLATIGAMVLVRAAWLHATPLHVLTSSIFGASWIFLYASSTLYHYSRCPDRKTRLKIIDHCAIFVTIAGSYGPFMAHVVGGWKGYGLWALVWLIAAVGSYYKFRSENRYGGYSVAAYVAQGWLVVILLPTLWGALSAQAIALMVAGGLIISGGTAFYVRRAMLFNHAIWHCFVLVGSICVYCCVLFHIVKPALGG